MEAAGQRPPAPGSGPSTSTPEPPAPPLPERVASSLSLNSESSEEDWLIKVCCPGACHRHCKNAKYIKPAKAELLQDRDKEDELAGCKRNTSYQIYTGVPRKESSDLRWLMRLHCPKAQMEQQKQSFPAVSSSPSTPPSKTGRGSLSARGKPPEGWLTQEHLPSLQAFCPPGSPISVCVLLPPFHPLSPTSYPVEQSYFPSFLPPFPFSLVSVSPSASPPMIVLPSILLPPSVPPYFFHFLPPLPPYLHSSSLFFHSPFLRLSLPGLSSPTVLPEFLFPPSPLPSPAASLPSLVEEPSQEALGKSPSRDFSAYHSHNPFFLPVLPPIQTHRRYQAREKNSDSAKYL